jgi:hypothetical protein
MCEVPYCERSGVAYELIARNVYNGTYHVVVCDQHNNGRHAALTQTMADNGLDNYDQRCEWCGYVLYGYQNVYHEVCRDARHNTMEYTLTSKDGDPNKCSNRTYLALDEARDHAIRMSGIHTHEYHVWQRYRYDIDGAVWTLLETWDRRTVFVGQTPTEWHYLQGPPVPEGWTPDATDVCFSCELPATPDNAIASAVSGEVLHIECLSSDLFYLYERSRSGFKARVTPYRIRGTERYCDTGCGTVIPSGEVAYRVRFPFGESTIECVACHAHNERSS